MLFLATGCGAAGADVIDVDEGTRFFWLLSGTTSASLGFKSKASEGVSMSGDCEIFKVE
jgi:hypothetical protein